MTTLSLAEKDARATLLAKISANLAYELREASTAAESTGPGADLKGSDPVLCREENLKSTLNEIRRIEGLLSACLAQVGIVIPERKAGRK